MATKCVVLVIGAGRSGTSAITRVLSLCGCGLPSSIVGAAVINQKGLWEPTDIKRLNDEYLYRRGSQYSDPSMRLEEMQSVEDHENESYIRHIQSFFSELKQDQVSIVKHPNITELMAFWLEAAGREKVSIKVVIPIRHPQEVFASIAGVWNRDTTSVEFTNAFWLKQNLLAERYSRNLPRIFIEYSSFLADWRAEVARVSKALQIDLNPDVPAIEDFLTVDLHHQMHSGPVTETFAYRWITRVYEALSAAARDDELNLETMEEIYHAYRTNERTFRIARSEFRAIFDSHDPKAFTHTEDGLPVFKKG